MNLDNIRNEYMKNERRSTTRKKPFQLFRRQFFCLQFRKVGNFFRLRSFVFRACVVHTKFQIRRMNGLGFGKFHLHNEICVQTEPQ